MQSRVFPPRLSWLICVFMVWSATSPPLPEKCTKQNYKTCSYVSISSVPKICTPARCDIDEVDNIDSHIFDEARPHGHNRRVPPKPNNQCDVAVLHNLYYQELMFYSLAIHARSQTTDH